MIKGQIQYGSMFSSECEYNIYYNSPSAFRGNPAATQKKDNLLKPPVTPRQFPLNPLSTFLLSQQYRENELSTRCRAVAEILQFGKTRHLTNHQVANIKHRQS